MDHQPHHDIASLLSQNGGASHASETSSATKVDVKNHVILGQVSEEERKALFGAMGKAADFGAASEEHARKDTSFEALCRLLQYTPNLQNPELILQNKEGERFLNMNLSFYADPTAELSKRFKLSADEMASMGVQIDGKQALIPVTLPLSSGAYREKADYGRVAHSTKNKYPTMASSVKLKRVKSSGEVVVDRPVEHKVQGGVQLPDYDARMEAVSAKREQEETLRNRRFGEPDAPYHVAVEPLAQAVAETGSELSDVERKWAATIGKRDTERKLVEGRHFEKHGVAVVKPVDEHSMTEKHARRAAEFAR